MAENAREYRNFGVVGREASFRVRPIPEGEDVYAWLENAFRELHSYAIRSCEAGDYVGMSFDSVNFARGPAGISFRPWRELSHEAIWDLVSSLAQSTGCFDVANTFQIRVFKITPPAGRGRNVRDVLEKRSIVTISNKDNLCFPRALAVALTYNERGNIRTGELQNKWNAVRAQKSTLQRRLACSLARNAGVVIPDEGCGIREIELFQRHLAGENIAIMVYSDETFGRGGKPLYDGCEKLASLQREIKSRLNILYYAGSRHYNVIVNLRAAAGTRDYCVPCNIGYRNDRGGHRCSNKCPRCNAVPSCEQIDAVRKRCDDCNREFFNHACLERHRAQKSYDGKSLRSICSVVRFCGECGRLIDRKKQHECGAAFCSTCRSPQPLNHFCHMQPLVGNSSARGAEEGNAGARESAREQESRTAFIFYDFETRQDETLQGCANTNIHVPTLCVAQQICESCADSVDTSTRCRWCGVRDFVFKRDPVKQLVELATRPTKYFKHVICIAHNAKSFDAQFILRFIVESANALVPRVILNGSKIVLLTVGNAKFIDSVNYMPMPLSELPKAFGLTGIEDKGIFPHLFNTRDNQSYRGPLPDVRYYSPETMNVKVRERFLSWHAKMTRENYLFIFENEIEKYCRNDVVILRRACMAFRKIFLERGGVCPFEECTTIASTCMRVFRKNFLREGEIGVIPSGGYRRADNQSLKALRWLIWMERELGYPIIHAGRSREYRLPDGTLVDGYYETSDAGVTRRYVLQFHGCFWHGCPTCYRINRDRDLSQNADRSDSMDLRYERTIASAYRLRKRGYELTEKWECVFDREMTQNEEMRDFLRHHQMIENKPLDPREAFYGGRTGNIVTRYEAAGTEKIRYLDVCSLYPYVLKTGVFPIGHPTVYVGEECTSLIGTGPGYNFDEVEGLVRCRVLPPSDLFHPVLPYRVRGKLLFALCRSCCETFSQLECTHTALERELEGTWVSCELRKAIEKNYLVTSVSEIWQYNSTRYDPVTRQGGLFTEYINTFLKLKQEASGWPGECGDDEDAKEQYLRDYAKVEGIVLDKNNISRNPGLRSVAKLCLNSFWGKFGQRTNLPNTEIVKTQQQLSCLLTSPRHEISDILPVNEDAMYVSWRLREEAVVPSPLTNVVIAAYTTAHARMVLYSYLEKLDRRVLYYDTDSCIYVSSGDPREYEPRTGNFLGDMTDELESYGRGSFIESFVSGGPKFYAYVVRTPEGGVHEICKVKGITLNFANSRLINFNSIKNLLLSRESESQGEENTGDKSINLRFRAIRRTAFHEIVTRDEVKSCSPVLLKRRFINSRISVPYGYLA